LGAGFGTGLAIGFLAGAGAGPSGIASGSSNPHHRSQGMTW
jgi:hypothetical protein